jgi:hypothetical protein
MVIPVILVLFMATVDAGRLLFAYIALEEAVHEGATYAAQVPGDPALIRSRVTSSSDHAEVINAVVPDSVCVPEDTSTTPPIPGTVTVTATSQVPLITPFGATIFGGTFQLGATVVATNLQGTC